MQTERYMHKPLYVDAVQVTEENMAEVADWCQGRIDEYRGKKMISVNVINPQTQRQTMAYVGDWVLKSASGFKVFTQKTFGRNFLPAPEETETITENTAQMELNFSNPEA